MGRRGLEHEGSEGKRTPVDELLSTYGLRTESETKIFDSVRVTRGFGS